MGISCEILIHKPLTGTHRAGQTVSGVIKYAIDKPTECKEVILSFTGKDQCYWTSRDPAVASHIGTEEYMSSFLSIFDKKSEDVGILLPGTYEREFEFTLPTNIPSSYDKKLVFIKYQLKLKFVSPGTFKSNKRYYATIPVRGFLESDNKDGPIIFGLQKALLKPFSTKKRLIDIKAKIENAIVKPGEDIQLSFVVKNDTNIDIKSVKSELLYTLTYTADNGRKKIKTSDVPGCVAETPSVPAEAIANLSSIVKTLPDLYTIQNSKVIERIYKVKVTVELPVPYANESVEMPVLIGFRTNDEPLETGTEPPSYWKVMCEAKDKNKY